MAAAVTTALGVDGRKVVIDAGAAIKLQRLERLGSELFTTSAVLAEVRDETARAMLATLPMELKIREPLPQDLLFVKQFAKATGDFGFLSQNDMGLIALTVQLHRENGGTVRDRPAPLIHTEGTTTAFDWAPVRADRKGGSTVNRSDLGDAGAVFEPPAHVAECCAHGAEEAPAKPEEPAELAEGAAGATAPMKEASSEKPGSSSDSNEVAEAPSKLAEPAEGAAAATAPTNEASSEKPGAASDSNEQARAEQKDEETKDEAKSNNDEPEEDPWSDEEDGSSAGEWVTVENMHRFGVAAAQADIEVKVTCATADYSVQNVLLQMGITPLTFDGYAVRSVKMWGLVCRACFFFTRETAKVFCPKCGHDTLVRVPIVVGEDGKPTALNNGRPLRKKGTVYSVPKPQGGRGFKPLFAEDELRIGGRDRELRRLENLANKERASRDPFNEDNGAKGWWQRGHTATGVTLTGQAPRVQAGYGRQNPNAGNFRGFKGKKR
eukprot:CAMPEP_0177195560 /NCGR_PEP_ID=MMETSP0367-20130122/23586_1 /TAXON_ID=447022 ORGANISM="Scrippsiella hangoei-like, Strain SHHI-4" /NCGR_SAMPLE_ID=MMETSP0367 /ASSEMBLY_ACC=CAM_ASM_000362 /LENGTH=493 /DNA_ID=CAMNT_0018643611 /DNA_START=52 /DNA_END=1533 /DNA_ORIENTATION=+